MRVPGSLHWIATFLIALSLLLSGIVYALDALDDQGMEQVSGMGIALAFDNFQFAMAPTSYFEQVGVVPAGACTTTGATAGNYNCWRRGDMRWYGVNISGAGGTSDGLQWDDTTACSSSSLACPRGGTVANFSPYDNPYLIRAWSPQGMDYNGTVDTTKAIYEFLAPTNQPNYTFSWWGEIETGSTRNTATQALATGAGTLLKSQTIIRGNAAGSIFRLFQTTDASQTFGMYYHSYLQGDFRFSVAQADNTHDGIGVVPTFDVSEGMFFHNVQAYVPLGQLYYQALTINPVGVAGGFAINLTALPNTVAVYNLAYSLNATDISTAGCAATPDPTGSNGCGFATAYANNTGGATSAAYQLTHGYIRYGGWTAAGNPGGLNTINSNNNTSTGDGISMAACSTCTTFNAYASSPVRIDKRGPTNDMQQTADYNCNTGNTGGCSTTAGFTNISASAGDTTRTYPTSAVNLGDSRIEGLMFQSLTFTSCSAIAGGC
jgi:hypothetical protein